MKFSLPGLSLLLFFPLTIFTQNNTVTVERYQKLDENTPVHSIVVGHDNIKWLATDKGLYKMLTLDDPIDVVTEDYSVMAGTVDRGGSVWHVSRWADLIMNDMESELKITDDTLLITGASASRGQIWVSTNQGIFTISQSQNRVLKHMHKGNSDLPSDMVNFIYLDPSNVWWIGTDEGIVRVEDKKWKVYEKKYRFTAATYTTEGMWLVSDREMWLVDKDNRWYPAGVRRGLSRGQVRALTSDSKGRVYLASEILVQFDPYTDKAVTLDEDYGFVSSESLALACDKNDHVWVGTADRGLFRVEVLEGGDSTLSAIVFQEKEIPCFGDTAAILQVVVKGGKPPFQISWNKPGLSGSRAVSLKSGIYQIKVEDALGQEYFLTAEVKDPDPLRAEFTDVSDASGANAYDGRATVQVSGGAGPYRLLWSNYKTAATVTNLPPGVHSVAVTDANDCRLTAEVTIKNPRILKELEDVTQLKVGQTLRIEQLYFEADSSVMTQESFAAIDEIHEFLEKNPDVAIEIGGHTNGLPPHEYCDRLSTARAKNIADYLFEKGIARNRISYKGYGKRNPIASNDTKQGRERNQRVEIKIVSIGS